MFWWMHGDLAWPWMVGGFLWMVLFWGAIIGVVVWAVSRLTHREPPTDSPLEIAKRRYARGEITREEFQRIKEDLTRGL